MQREADATGSAYTDMINNIDGALRSYALTHGQFPAPADPKVDFTSLNNTVTGNAGKPSAAAQSMTCPSTIDNIVCVASNGGYVEIGALPYQILGIPMEKALDHYGHKYTYAVSREQLNTNGLADGGYIKIVNQYGTVYTGSPAPAYPDHGASYVIISHGPDGLGAYNADGTGGPSTCPAATSIQNQNCNNDGTFLKLAIPPAPGGTLDNTYNLNKASASLYFDDSILYNTTAATNLWTQKTMGGVVATLMTNGQGKGNVLIGTARSGTTPAAGIEVGSGGNAFAPKVETARVCDTQNAVSSSRCMTVSSIVNTSDSSLKCGHYAMTRIKTPTSNAYGAQSAPDKDCDTSPTITSSSVLPTACPNGATGYNADGTLQCAP